MGDVLVSIVESDLEDGGGVGKGEVCPSGRKRKYGGSEANKNKIEKGKKRKLKAPQKIGDEDDQRSVVDSSGFSGSVGKEVNSSMGVVMEGEAANKKRRTGRLSSEKIKNRMRGGGGIGGSKRGSEGMGKSLPLSKDMETQTVGEELGAPKIPASEINGLIDREVIEAAISPVVASPTASSEPGSSSGPAIVDKKSVEVEVTQTKPDRSRKCKQITQSQEQVIWKASPKTRRRPSRKENNAGLKPRPNPSNHHRYQDTPTMKLKLDRKRRKSIARVGGGQTRQSQVGRSKPLPMSWLWVYREKRRLCRGITTLPNQKRRSPNMRKKTANVDDPAVLTKNDLSVDKPENEEGEGGKKKVTSLYKCPFCFDIYATNDGLIEHLPIHTGRIMLGKSSKGNDPTAIATTSSKTDGNQVGNQGTVGEIVTSKPKTKGPGPRSLTTTTSAKHSPSNGKIKTNCIISTSVETVQKSAMPPLPPCTVVLSRCDHLVSAWKPNKSKPLAILSSDKKEVQCTKLLSPPPPETMMDMDAVVENGKPKRKAGIQARLKILETEMREEKASKDDDTDTREIGQAELMASDKEVEQLPSSKQQSSDLISRHSRTGPASQREPKAVAAGGRSRNTKLQQCPICSKEVSNLEPHILSHTREKPYQCLTCLKEFSTASSLKSHMLTHTGDKLFKCEACSKGFLTADHLKLHNRTHTGEKPHVCPTCSKGFARGGALKLHLVTHTGERNFECEICSKAFAQPTSLYRHKKRKHSKSPNEGSYKCPTCSEAFPQPEQLKQHIRQHMEELQKQLSCL